MSFLCLWGVAQADEYTRFKSHRPFTFRVDLDSISLIKDEKAPNLLRCCAYKDEICNKQEQSRLRCGSEANVGSIHNKEENKVFRDVEICGMGTKDCDKICCSYESGTHCLLSKARNTGITVINDTEKCSSDIKNGADRSNGYVEEHNKNCIFIETKLNGKVIFFRKQTETKDPVEISRIDACGSQLIETLDDCDLKTFIDALQHNVKQGCEMKCDDAFDICESVENCVQKKCEKFVREFAISLTTATSNENQSNGKIHHDTEENLYTYSRYHEDNADAMIFDIPLSATASQTAEGATWPFQSTTSHLLTRTPTRSSYGEIPLPTASTPSQSSLWEIPDPTATASISFEFEPVSTATASKTAEGATWPLQSTTAVVVTRTPTRSSYGEIPPPTPTSSLSPSKSMLWEIPDPMATASISFQFEPISTATASATSNGATWPLQSTTSHLLTRTPTLSSFGEIPDPTSPSPSKSSLWEMPDSTATASISFQFEPLSTATVSRTASGATWPLQSTTSHLLTRTPTRSSFGEIPDPTSTTPTKSSLWEIPDPTA